MNAGMTIARLATGLLIVAGAGCTAASVGNTTARADRGPDRELEALQALIGDAACRDDAQCRTLPVGSLACGGPASYMPWSTLRSNEAALNAAAAPLAQRRPGSAPGEMSICRMLPDPGARCVTAPGSALGTCRLRERSDGSGGALPTR
jgi:hypothetical protein